MLEVEFIEQEIIKLFRVSESYCYNEIVNHFIVNYSICVLEENRVFSTIRSLLKNKVLEERVNAGLGSKTLWIYDHKELFGIK